MKLPATRVIPVLLLCAMPLWAQGQTASAQQKQTPPAQVPTSPAPPPSPHEPLTPKNKFVLSLKNTFYPTPLVTAAAAAGISQGRDSSLDNEYGQGFDGFKRRWASEVGNRATGEFFGTFVAASLLHQDPHYHPSPRRGFGHRLGHAVSRVFVAPSDSGATQFNTSNLIGNAAAAGMSNAWHHRGDRGGAETAQRFGYAFVFDAVHNLFSEFFLHRKAHRDP